MIKDVFILAKLMRGVSPGPIGRAPSRSLVDQFEGKKLNAPNDIAVTKHGHVYFTDPAFGSAVKNVELPFYGVFHISPKGQVEASLRLADAAEWCRRQSRRRHALRDELR